MINQFVNELLSAAGVNLPEGAQLSSVSGHVAFSAAEKLSLVGEIAISFSKAFVYETPDKTKVKVASLVRGKIVDNGLEEIQGINVDLIGPVDPAIKKIVYLADVQALEVSGFGFKQLVPVDT